jgi:putative solute:sodium symporter small subunit
MNTSIDPSRSGGVSVRTWTSIRKLTVVLALVWLSLSVGVAWFARDLYEARGNDFPTGVWFVVQASLLAYVILIVVYVVACERVESAGASPPSAGLAEDASRPQPASRS